MSFDLDTLQQHIPHYLTSEDKKVLVGELNAIASGNAVDYTLSSFRDSFEDVMLQGDGWTGFRLFDFESDELRSVRGLVLSNSCDVDLNNTRDVPSRVIFAPLVKLASYERLLITNGIDRSKVEEKVRSIRAQKTSNVFYLPAGGGLEEDYIVRLDEVHSMPVSVHGGDRSRQKKFTLNNTGFYMLVFKLSVHFCRLQEKVGRREPVIDGPVS